MQPFHVNIYARSETVQRGVEWEWNGQRYPTLAFTPACRSVSFPVSFEQAAERLIAIPRLFFEPDGSFVWVSADRSSPRWQIDGHLYDHHDRLYTVDLKGCCPASEMDRLLACFGWPTTELVFQIVTAGMCVDEQVFRHIVSYQ